MGKVRGKANTSLSFDPCSWDMEVAQRSLDKATRSSRSPMDKTGFSLVPFRGDYGPMSKASKQMQETNENSCAVCHTTLHLRPCPCKKVYYCGSVHQKADWKRHKAECTV